MCHPLAIAVAALLAWSGTASAQRPRAPRPRVPLPLPTGRLAPDTAERNAIARGGPRPRGTGLRLATQVAAGGQYVANAGREFWPLMGRAGGVAGAGIAAGYDHRGGWGVALAADVLNAPVDVGNGRVYALAASGSWRPRQVFFRRWTPRLSLGYVRQGFLVSALGAADRPVGPGVPAPVVGSYESVSVTGNGVRVGAALERSLGRRTILSVGLGGDAVRFSEYTVGGGSTPVPRAFVGVTPRVQLGLAYRVF